MFMALPLIWKLGSVVVVLLALTGAWFGITNYHYNKGWEAHRVETERLDEEAESRGEEFRTPRRECRSSGGTWDTPTGVCKR